MTANPMAPTPLILRYLPTFAWQTPMEIITMLEQVNEDVRPESIVITLWRLKKKGILVTKKAPVDRTRAPKSRLTITMFRRLAAGEAAAAPS